MGIIGKELPKFFEQILDITDPWYIEKIEQQGNTINIYVDFKFFIADDKLNLTTV